MSHGLILPKHVQAAQEAKRQQAMSDELIADADASPGAYALAIVRMQETDCDAATALAQVLTRRSVGTVHAHLSEMADRMVYMAMAPDSATAMMHLLAAVQNPETWEDDDAAGG